MEQHAELILIVEDEPKLAQLLTDYLRSDGLGAGEQTGSDFAGSDAAGERRPDTLPGNPSVQ